MPRGAQSYTRHAAAVEQRRAAALEKMGPYADYFSVSAGQMSIIRFLEQGEEIAYASMHKIVVSNSKYPVDVLCLDQNDDGTPCPFCMSDMKEVRSRRTFGFLNVIQRGGEFVQSVNQSILAQNQQRAMQGMPPYMTYTQAPVYKRSQNGFPEKDEQTKQKIVVGYADGVFLWKCSNTVLQELLNKDQTYRGLMSRDFTVRRQGSSMQDTVYFIEPYDVNTAEVPMSPTDQALAAAKFEIDKFITPMSFEDAQKLLSGQVATAPGAQFQRGAGIAPAGMMQDTPMPQVVNPFAPGATPMSASQPPPPVQS